MRKENLLLLNKKLIDNDHDRDDDDVSNKWALAITIGKWIP